MERIRHYCCCQILLLLPIICGILTTQAQLTYLEDGSVRLVDGSSPAEGRVEVLYGGRWGTVCDDGWDIQDARVVCKQLGFADANATRCCGHFSHGTGSIVLDDLSCLGTEDKIGDCNHRGWEQHNCAHTEDAGVICVDKIRLSDGATSLEGRVEVFNNNTWGTICDQKWDRNDADVICRQLGFPSSNSSKSGAFYGEGDADSPVLITNSSCIGNETSIENCPNDMGDAVCPHSQDAGVICTRPIRLLGGMNPLEGRVEIFNGTYGTICDENWGMEDAIVVCKQLGNFAALTATKGSQFTAIGAGPRLPVLMNNVACDGTEDTLEQCGHDGWGNFNDMTCSSNRIAGVKCTPSVRLTGGTSHIDGYVEIYYNGEWGRVCADQWDLKDAEVVCRQLGNYPVSAFSTATSSASQAITGGLRCTGNESAIQDCQHSAWKRLICDGYAQATCQATVKLVGGSNNLEGNVQIRYNGVFGSICDDNWDINDAEVVCRQLGNYEAVSASCCSKYGAITEENPIILDDVNCEGSEGRIEDCYHGSWNSHNCGNQEAAGVVCRCQKRTAQHANVGTKPPAIRLVKDGQITNLPEGRVEVVHNGQWGRICGDGWDINDANVLCKQLYNSSAESVSTDINSGPSVGILSNFGCNGDELDIFECTYDPWGQYNCTQPDAAVVCRGGLRLVGGRNELEGRVEIFHDGQWGTICDDNWDENDARVVCRQHGNYEVLAAKCCSAFGQGTGPILLDGVACTGEEKVLEECGSEGWGSHNCQHYEDSSVICTDLKLTFDNGSVSTNMLQGRVELLRDGIWGTVCYDGWDIMDAEVVCQQLFNTSAMEATGKVNNNRPAFNTFNVKCDKTQKLLKNCPSDDPTKSPKCKSDKTAGVNCKDIRLVGGPPDSRATGVVEILHNNQWGSVCSDNWSIREGTVACRQLGYCGVRSVMKGLEVPRSGSVTMHWQKVNCTGEENRLRDCDYKTGAYGCNGATFEAVVACKDACDFPGQLRHGDLKPDMNFYDIQDTISLSCGKNYELIGNSTLTCTNTCEWDSGMPECQRNGKSGTSSLSGSGSGSSHAGMFIGGLILGIVCVLIIVAVIVVVRRRRTRSTPSNGINSIWKPKSKQRDDMEEPVLSFNSKHDHDGLDDGDTL